MRISKAFLNLRFTFDANYSHFLFVQLAMPQCSLILCGKCKHGNYNVDPKQILICQVFKVILALTKLEVRL